jgi:hypothetical protein
MEETMPNHNKSRSKGTGKCLILATGSSLQYRTLRCAAAYFDEAYVLGTAEARPLSLSFACKGFYETPVGKDHIHDLSISLVNKICSEMRIGHVLPSDGSTTRYLTASKGYLNPICYPVPTTQTFDTLDNKLLFTELCESLNLPCPATYFAENEAAVLELARRGDITSPSVAKPLNMFGSFGVTKLVWSSPTDLVGQVTYKPILIQKYIGGIDVSAFFLCRQGTEIASVLYRKNHRQLEFIEIPEIMDACRRINEHFRYDGVIGFDVRISPDGSFYFLECNPRFWYNMHVAYIAGLNFVALGFGSSSSAAPPLSIKGVSVINPKPLLRKIATPWKLDDLDRQALGYFRHDLLSNLWMLQQRMSRDGRVAHGQQL